MSIIIFINQIMPFESIYHNNKIEIAKAPYFSRSKATKKKSKTSERSELLLPPPHTGFAGAMNATFSSPSPAGRRCGAYRDVFTAWLAKVAFIAQTQTPTHKPLIDSPADTHAAIYYPAAPAAHNNVLNLYVST